MPVLIQKFLLFPVISNRDIPQGVWVCLELTVEDAAKRLNLVNFEQPKFERKPKYLEPLDVVLLSKQYCNFYVSGDLSQAEIQELFESGRLEASVLSEIPTAETIQDLARDFVVRIQEFYTETDSQLASRIQHGVESRLRQKQRGVVNEHA